MQQSTDFPGMLNRRLTLILALSFVAPAFVHLSAQAVQVEGIVRDASGAAIAQARVDLRSDSVRTTTETDTAGRFSFSHVVGRMGTLEVSAAGFAVARQSWNVEANQTSHMEIVLQPSPAKEQVTVSAART